MPASSAQRYYYRSFVFGLDFPEKRVKINIRNHCINIRSVQMTTTSTMTLFSLTDTSQSILKSHLLLIASIQTWHMLSNGRITAFSARNYTFWRCLYLIDWNLRHSPICMVQTAKETIFCNYQLQKSQRLSMCNACASNSNQFNLNVAIIRTWIQFSVSFFLVRLVPIFVRVPRAKTIYLTFELSFGPLVMCVWSHNSRQTQTQRRRIHKIGFLGNYFFFSSPVSFNNNNSNPLCCTLPALMARTMPCIWFIFITLNFMAIVMYERRANTCTVWVFVWTQQRVVDLDRLNWWAIVRFLLAPRLSILYLLQRVGVQSSIHCDHEREFVSPKSFGCFRHLKLYLVYSFQFKFTVHQNSQLSWPVTLPTVYTTSQIGNSEKLKSVGKLETITTKMSFEKFARLLFGDRGSVQMRWELSSWTKCEREDNDKEKS